MIKKSWLAIWVGLLSAAVGEAASAQPVEPEAAPSSREAYYGELHLHTSYSFDSYVGFGTKVDPDGAYRFGKGEPVDYLGKPAQRAEPLDFMAVTDHSEYMGVTNLLEDPDSAFSRSELGKAMRSYMSAGGSPGSRKPMPRLVAEFFDDWLVGKLPTPADRKAEIASAWQRQVAIANRHNRPGKFTTFIGYEWTSRAPEIDLHRNVIFKGDSPPLPFTARDSRHPADLWAWLDDMRSRGYEALAIPHNMNLSNGYAYDWVDSRGNALDERHAKSRQRNEPLSEISQSKGTSETHPMLSPEDEFAGYQVLERVEATRDQLAGSYVRSALGRGLVLERKLGVNPFKFGFAGAADMHAGLSINAQAQFGGGFPGVNLGGAKLNRQLHKFILNEEQPFAGSKFSGRHFTAASLTAVWAESNTRDAIFDALRRRETFATTGTRIKLRFFGGWDFAGQTMNGRDWVVAAYARGTPMGTDLPDRPGAARAPSFLVWAVKDPNGAPLDRVQVVKVWEEHGEPRERIFDVAWSGSRKPDIKTGRVGAVGNTVDLKTGRLTGDIGAAELKTVWTDPQFRVGQAAVYYLRVLEVPTARWSTLLAIENQLPLPKDVPSTEQQRAWSSPIWYRGVGASR